MFYLNLIINVCLSCDAHVNESLISFVIEIILVSANHHDSIIKKVL